MSSRRFLAVFATLVCATPIWADIRVGDTREEVLRQHGFPTSIAKRGDNEYFVYPKGGRIELLGGKVTDVRGPLPPRVATADTTPAAATPAPAAAYQPTTTPPPTSAVPAKPTPQPAPTKPAPPPRVAPATADDDTAAATAAATAALSAHIDKMDTAWGSAPPPPPKPHSPLDSIPSFLSFLAGLVLRFGFTLAALKLAFKYWEMDAFWKGVFAIAGIDVGLHAFLELLGTVTGGLTTMSAVENGLPGLVLIYTINRFCFNKRLQNALATAAAVKVVVTLLYIFGAVALLNVAFG